MSNGTPGGVNREPGRDDQLRPELSRPEQERHVQVRTEHEPLPETESERIERKILETQRAAEVRERPAALPAAQPSAPAPVDPVVKEIENILSEDLGPIYRAMTPAQQRVFKVEGERTATAIRRLLEQLKVRAKTILDLIRRWLRVIPGVNKFFMEQEAKIKTDKVMALHDQLHRQ